MCRFVGSELVNSEDNIPDRAGVGVLLKLEDLAAELSPIRQVIRRNAPKPNIMLLKLQINNNCFVPLFGCFPNYHSHAHSTPMNNNLCLSLFNVYHSHRVFSLMAASAVSVKLSGNHVDNLEAVSYKRLPRNYIVSRGVR
jgi:hypothetical protein